MRTAGAPDDEQAERQCRETQLRIPAPISASSKRGLRPIILVHGLGGHAGEMNGLARWLRRRSDRLVLSVKYCEGRDTITTPLWKQMNQLWACVESAKAARPREFEQGYHIVAHSQGALLARGLVTTRDNHGVRVLISMAGPQCGIQALSSKVIEWLCSYAARDGELASLFLRRLAAEAPRNPSLPYKLATGILSNFAPLGYWSAGLDDEDAYQEYVRRSLFLARINNQTYWGPSMADADSRESLLRQGGIQTAGCCEGRPRSYDAAGLYDNFARNLLAVEKIVCLVGANDEVIQPVECGLLGSAGACDLNFLEAIARMPFASMERAGRLQNRQLPSCAHLDWVSSTYCAGWDFFADELN